MTDNTEAEAAFEAALESDRLRHNQSTHAGYLAGLAHVQQSEARVWWWGYSSRVLMPENNLSDEEIGKMMRRAWKHAATLSNKAPANG